MVVDEDSFFYSPGNTILTNADARLDDPSTPENESNIWISPDLDDRPEYGDAMLIEGPDGEIIVAYQPYEDYSGEDQFKYIYRDEDESVHSITVDVTVNPISDAPILTVYEDIVLQTGDGQYYVETPEDQPVALGFEVPEVKDDDDQNGSLGGDYPERLGLITLTGIPANAELLDGSNGQ